MRIFFATFLVTVLLFLSGCKFLAKPFLKDPEVKVLEVKVTAISLTDIAVDVLINIKNPNQVSLALDSVTYELSLAGETVTAGTFSEGLNVPAAGQKNIKVPLLFKFKSVGNILSRIINKSFAKEYELKGSVKIGIFSIPFSQKGEVNLNH